MNAEPIKFLNHFTSNSQLVISEAAASCMANAIARSEIGKIMINKDKIKKMFSSYRLGDYLFTTTSIRKYIPIFERKLGKNMDLHLDLSFKDINILFG